MPTFEFNAEVTADVDIEVDITVQDSSTGEKIDSNAEGDGTDITVNIDLSDLRENIIDAAREDFILQDRVYLIEEIGNATNPMQALAEFILLVGNADKINKEKTSNRLRDLGANIKALEIVVAERDKEISTLTQHIADRSEVSLQRPDKTYDQIRLARSDDALAIIAGIKARKE